MKKILGTLVLFTAAIMPRYVMALAYTYTRIVDGITWTFTIDDDDKTSIGSGSPSGARAIPTSTTGAIVIPSTFYGHSVTSIGDYAFDGCRGLTSVTIPSSVTSIGLDAFYCCSKMTSVTISEGVTSIGSCAFQGCSSLPNVTIPSSVTSIGEYAFLSCSGLASVTIPSSVTSIGRGAFAYCSKLTSVTISEGVTSIGSCAFDCCSKLQSIDFEGTPPEGLSGAAIPSTAAIRYNKHYADEWAMVIRQCGFQNAVPYDPRPALTIMPESGSVFVDNLSVSISSSDGEPIHYTIDGSEPTTESPAYSKKFRISKKTIVKAIAVYDNGMCSDVVVAEYAKGTCTDPAISPADGTIFSRSNQAVSIDWNEADGVVRYTLDGSEPTEGSTAYSSSFAISETTTVKAKVFSENYFDSQVVTAKLTRKWLTVDAPTISADTYFVGAENKVSIVCSTAGATIYYTTDGSTPTSSSKVYNGTFAVTNSCVVKAIALCDDMKDSNISSIAITRSWLSVAAPSISAAENFIGAKTPVEISCATEGAAIYYTLDGSEPTTSSMLYCGTFDVTNSCTVRAISILSNDVYRGMPETSFVITRNWLPISDVTISAKEAFVGASTPVTLSCDTEGAAIYYTLDGSEPTTQSTAHEGTFDVTNSCMVRALAVLSNEVYRGTSETSFAITRNWLPVAAPSISAAENFIGTKTPVGISCATEGAAIYYTLDGSEPSASSTLYGGIFDVTNSCTIRAISILSNEVYRGAAETNFTITRSWLPVAAPSISSKAMFTGSKTPVEIFCATEGAAIYYTTDGSAPSVQSFVYESPFNVTNSCTVRAISILSNDVYRGAVEVSFAIEKIWTIGDALNVPDMTFTTTGDAEWVRDTETTHDGMEAMRSGEINNNQQTEIATTVEGAGVFSFWLKTSCEDSDGYYDYDRVEFYADDSMIPFDGQHDWTNVVFRLNAEGTHTFRWVYMKDNVEKDGDDCVWLDEIKWTAGKSIEQGEICEIMPEGLDSPLAVSNDWLIAKGLAKEGDSVAEVAAKMSSNGKNGIPRYQSYVLGMEPDSDVPAEEQLKVTISGFDKDGEPVISYEPTPNDATHVTVKKLGRKTLPTSDDTGWSEVVGNEADFNFFKVKVEVK